jgi:hypothetical protein
MKEKGRNMPRFIDLKGEIYGRLKVLSRAENDKQNKIQWLCECKCGSKIISSRSSLRGGETRSCGCYHLDKISKKEVEDFDLSRRRPYIKRIKKSDEEKLEKTKKEFFLKVEKTPSCWIWKG